MEPVHYSLQAFLRGVLILGLSLSVFAQIPAAPDASGFPSSRKVPDFPLTALPPVLISQKYPRVFRNPACAVPMALVGSRLALMSWILEST